MELFGVRIIIASALVISCLQSVRACSDLDSDTNCEWWAKRGECIKTSDYMLKNCKKSCGKCPGIKGVKITVCKDEESKCQRWAESGECKTNPTYMLPKCMKSCGVCDVSITAPVTPTIPVSRGPIITSPATQIVPKVAVGKSSIGSSKRPVPTIPASKKPTITDIKGPVPTPKRLVPTPVTDGPVLKNNASRYDCKDSRTECKAWAKSGMCKSSPNYVVPNCMKTCGVCHSPVVTLNPVTNIPITIKPVTTPKTECTDSRTECHQWAVRGECKTNSGWMLPNCQKSCGVCSKTSTTTRPVTNGPVTTPITGTTQDCEDRHSLCPYWSSVGYCYSYGRYMYPSCTKSCGWCNRKTVAGHGSCSDDDLMCGYWASIGECRTNSGYMVPHCPRSCRLCS